jgi:hypothetical protein
MIFLLILIIFSFSIPIVFRKYTGSIYCSLSLLLIGTHYLVALCNAYFYPIQALSLDAATFNFQALNHLGSLSLGSQSYPWALSFFYNLYPSIMMGQSLSILAYSISSVVFFFLIDHFGFRRHRFSMLLLFTFLSAAIIFKSGVLREAWEVLFVMLFSFYSIKLIEQTKFNIVNAASILLWAILAGFLHVGILFGCLVCLAILAFLKLCRFRSISLSQPLFIILCSIGFVLLALSLFYFEFRFPDVFSRIFDYATRTQGQREAVTYYHPLQGGGLFALLVNYFYYLFYPFIWSASGTTSLLAGCLSMIRVFLFIGSCRSITVLSKYDFLKAKSMKLLLVNALVFSFLFSIGTSNYGTSMRHNLLSDWVFILLGVPGLFFLPRTRLSGPLRMPGTSPDVRAKI